MVHEVILEGTKTGLGGMNNYLKAKIERAKIEGTKEEKKQRVERETIRNFVNKNISLNSSILKSMQKISGVFSNPDEFETYIKTLMPGSFGFWYEFELKAPYFSADNDALHILHNPILKEKTSKLPMVMGSSWKGLLAMAARRRLQGEAQKEGVQGVLKQYKSFIRVFGTGSKEFRALQAEVEKVIEGEERKNADQLHEELFKYCLIDLGLKLKFKKDGTGLVKQLIDAIIQGQYNGEVEEVFTVRRGRAIFYPTYFDRIGYKIINPHNRIKRTGDTTIYFEVVSAKSQGLFQLIYIPYDGMLTPEKMNTSEIQEDRMYLKETFKYALKDIGIGAKTKLGWGRAAVETNAIKCFFSGAGENKNG